jgi:hypothetical protein
MLVGGCGVITTTVANIIIKSRKIFNPNTTIYLSMRSVSCFSYHSHHQAGYENKKEKFTAAYVSDLRTLQDNIISIYTTQHSTNK